MNQSRIKNEYIDLVGIGARVETTRNWGIERNRLIFPNVVETEVAGQQKGIRVLTGLTAKAQKTAGKAVDIVIDGKTLTVNKASFIKWCQRTILGEELLKNKTPLIFNSSFIQKELDKYLSKRPSVAALLDNSNPEAQKAAMAQLDALFENTRTSSRSSKQASPNPSATNSSLSSSRSSLIAPSLSNNQSEKNADRLMEDAELMIQSSSCRIDAQLVTEEELPTVDVDMVDHLNAQMKGLQEGENAFNFGELLGDEAPTNFSAKEETVLKPILADIMEAQKEWATRSIEIDLVDYVMLVNFLNQLKEEQLERNQVQKFFEQEEEEEEEESELVDPHTQHLEDIANSLQIDRLEVLKKQKENKMQAEIESMRLFSEVDTVTPDAAATESTTAAGIPTLSTAQQTTRTVKSKKSRKLSAPKFIMLTFATTAIASLAIWGTKSFSNTNSLTLENLENDVSTCPLDFSANISQMAQTTLRYACEAFYYLTSDQFQFDAIRALFKANTDFFNFVQSQENFSSFLGNTTQAGYDIIAPVAKNGLDQVADIIEIALHGFGSYVQQATDNASHLLNNTIIPNLQPMMAPLSNGISTTIETVQSFFVRPGYTMNHVYDGWKDYVASTLDQLPYGISEKGTNPMTPGILNWTNGQSHRLIQ